MGNKKKKKKLKKPIGKIFTFLGVLLPILGLISQMYFDNPFFIRNFNKVELAVKEYDLMKNDSITGGRVLSTFIIENIGDNTAEKVEFLLRTPRGSSVIIYPPIFELTNEQNPKPPVLNNIYSSELFVPNEIITISVYTPFKEFLNINSLDTLIHGKPLKYPKYLYGPRLIYVKHTKGQVTIQQKDSLRLIKN